MLSDFPGINLSEVCFDMVLTHSHALQRSSFQPQLATHVLWFLCSRQVHFVQRARRNRVMHRGSFHTLRGLTSYPGRSSGRSEFRILHLSKDGGPCPVRGRISFTLRTQWLNVWRFPEMVVLPNHPILMGFSCINYKPSIWGYPHLWKVHILEFSATLFFLILCWQECSYVDFSQICCCGTLFVWIYFRVPCGFVWA